MKVFRITHKKWSKLLTASGYPARWNSNGIYVIYTAESRALACLENIVHRGSYDLMAPFILIEIYIPDDILVEEILSKDLPARWNKSGDKGYQACQPFGDSWIEKNRTAVLKVPSVLVPKESNYLINPLHPRFPDIRIVSEDPFIFDERIKKSGLT